MVCAAQCICGTEIMIAKDEERGMGMDRHVKRKYVLLIAFILRHLRTTGAGTESDLARDGGAGA